MCGKSFELTGLQDERTPALMEHQAQGVDFIMKNKKALLYWACGSGKTLTTLEALRRLGCKNVLIVAPVSLLSVWRDELLKFYAQESVSIRGTWPKREGLWKNAGYKIVGYETLRQDFDKMPKAFDAIVLDEAAKIANPVAKITKRIMKLEAQIKVVLNGTLLANSIGDLWAPCEWLERGVLLGNWYAFKRVYAIQHPYIQGATLGYRNVPEIEKKCAHLISRKTEAEVLTHLPPVTEQIITFQLSPKERAVYERIRKESLVNVLGDDVTVGNALVELLRLKQTTNGVEIFGEDEPSSKIRVLKELIATMPEESKVVIFSNFKTTVDKITEELPEALKITGDVPSVEREYVLEKFRNNPKRRFLVMTSSGEKGINAQCANFIVHIDLPWTQASFTQRLGRVWRTGQINHVHSYTLQAEKTIDEYTQKILNRKKQLADDFQGYTKEDLSLLLQ